MADAKITALTELTSVTNSDLLAVVDDPGGSPITKKATVGNVMSASGLVLTLPQINDTSSDHQYVFTVSELTADRNVTLPLLTGNDEFTFNDHAQTLTNKTLTSPVLTTPQINDTSADHQYITAVSELTADRTVTLPLLTGNDEFVFKDHAQTLTNKTLTSPKINEDVALTATATQLNAQVLAGNDGWTSANETWTYASASTITVPSGAASKYSVGDKIKLTANSVVLYAYIRTVADTLLTVSGNALTSHTFTNNYYSHQDSPLGFTPVFSYTPTLSADSTNPTLGSSTLTGLFWVTGKVCNVEIKLTINTSGWNAGSGIYRFSLPMTCSVNGVSHPGVSLLIDYGSSVTICLNEIWGSGTLVNLVMLPGFSNLTNSTLTWADGDGIFVNCQYKIA